MKKLLAAVAVVGLALPVISFASAAPVMPAANNIDPFTGFYVGAGVGFNNQFFSDSFKNAADDVHRSTNLGNYGASGHLYGGFNYGFNPDWMVGLDVHAQYNGASPAKRRADFDAGEVARHSANLQWQYGLSVKLGYAPFARNMFYVFAGPEWTQLKYKMDHVGYSDSENSTQFGGLVGLGASQSLMENLNLVEQFGYGFYQSKSRTFANGDTAKVTPTDNTLMVALEYHFS